MERTTRRERSALSDWVVMHGNETLYRSGNKMKADGVAEFLKQNRPVAEQLYAERKVTAPVTLIDRRSMLQRIENDATHKPRTWGAVQWSDFELSARDLHIIATLPVVTLDPEYQPSDDLSEYVVSVENTKRDPVEFGLPEAFVAQFEQERSKRYLVIRSGYDYCRYATRIA